MREKEKREMIDMIIKESIQWILLDKRNEREKANRISRDHRNSMILTRGG
jgi:hypothetical protein